MLPFIHVSVCVHGRVYTEARGMSAPLTVPGVSELLIAVSTLVWVLGTELRSLAEQNVLFDS